MTTTHDFPDAALNENIGIFGTTGSGKSFTARGLVERVMKRRTKPRMCILDPKGDWWGARLTEDGHGPGIPFTIIGGPHADAGLRLSTEEPERAAKPLASMIATTDVRCVIDLSDLDAGKMRRFVAILLSALYHENRQQLYLVMDEADEFAPMNCRGESTPVSLGATERIAKRGRGRGFVFWPITQRPASVHTDIRGMMQSLVIQKLTLPHDRRAIKEWFDGQMPGDDKAAKDALDAVISSLPKLSTGEGWLWCPKVGDGAPVRGRFPRIWTYDSMKAPTPGDATRDKPLPQIDTKAVTSALEEATKAAIENDPKALKLKVADLERQLAERPEPAPAEPDLAALEDAEKLGGNEARRRLKNAMAPLLDNLAKMAGALVGNAEAVQHQIAEASRLAGTLTADAKSLGSSLDALTTILEAPQAEPSIPAGKPTRFIPRIIPATGRVTHQNGTAKAPKGKAGARERMLGVLAEFERLGMPSLDRRNLAVLSGQSPKSSTFHSHMGAMVSEGDATASGPGEVALTDQGRRKAPKVEPIRSLRELHDRWASKLEEKQGVMLGVLLDAYPKSIDREVWAQRSESSFTSSTFHGHAGQLVSLGVVETDGPGKVKAGSVLFPAGLR